MHLVVDGQALQTRSSRTRGIGRFVTNLFLALGRVRPEWRLELVENEELEPIDGKAFSNFPIRRFRPLASGVRNKEVNELYYADWLTAAGPHAVLIPSFFEDSAIVPRFVGSRPPVFGVVYDLIPLLFHERYLQEPQTRRRYGCGIRKMLMADCLFTISETTAKDLKTLLNVPAGRIVNIGGAPDPCFLLSSATRSPVCDQLSKRLGLEREFILYVGGSDFRKNLPGALQAFACLPSHLRKRLDFMIVCDLSERECDFITGTAGSLGIGPSLKLTGRVSDAELVALYQLCRVFFFPSLYEGLGFPVLEALACGAPVVASDLPAVREFAGSLCWLVDPSCPKKMADGLTAALSQPRDAEMYGRVGHASRFRWEVCAERVACALRAPLPRRRSRRRSRIAWVSPFPPSRSGIGDYSAELISGLRENFEIEIVVDSTSPAVRSDLAANHLLLRSMEVSARHEACPYDLFVYQVGNSCHHLYMLELMWRFQGLLVVHDFFLGELVYAAIRSGQWPGSLLQELELERQTELTQKCAEGVIPEWEIIECAPLNRRILSAAEVVVVHSGWCWRNVRKITDVPVARIPVPVSRPRLVSRAEARARLGLAKEFFIVCTLGQISTSKRIESLLRAVAALPPRIRDRTQIVLVGDSPPGYERQLLTLASQVGIRSNVYFVGHVSSDDYAAYSCAADVCVQLRFPSRGETSAALLGALAAGGVCVISAGGPMEEIPADVALKVRSPDYEVEDLTRLLEQLYGDCDLRDRLSRAARRYVRETHDVEQILARYTAAINMAVARRHCRDASWCEFACNSLADALGKSVSSDLVEAWCDLRYQAQKRMSQRRQAEDRSDYD